VRKHPDQVGFAVNPRRWMVERLFAWLSRSRRLAKDFEATIASTEISSMPLPSCSSPGDWPEHHMSRVGSEKVKLHALSIGGKHRWNEKAILNVDYSWSASREPA
jgi:hypothetical protein